MTAARPDTWMPTFWGDYDRDTGHLNDSLHGAYLMLIKHYWCTGKPLPDDDALLWRIACCDSPQIWRTKRRPILEKFFHIQDGAWRHGRIDKELAAATARVERRSNAGQRGAAQRWGQRSDANGNGMAMPSESHEFANGQSQSQSQEDERTSKLVGTVARAMRAPRRRPNFRDPDVKQAAWFDRVLAFVKTKLPDDQVASLLASYLDHEPSAVREWERWASLEKDAKDSA